MAVDICRNAGHIVSPGVELSSQLGLKQLFDTSGLFKIHF